MTKIFISYRRAVNSGDAGRLYDRLAEKYVKKNVFLDVDNIPAGETFETYILTHIAESDIFLILLAEGVFDRIHDENDWVRREIAHALKNKNVHIVPVLVDGFKMPEAESLPDDIRKLTERNAALLIHEMFDASIEKIIDGINQQITSLPSREVPKEKPPPSVDKVNVGSDSKIPCNATVTIGVALLTIIVGLGFWTVQPEYGAIALFFPSETSTPTATLTDTPTATATSTNAPTEPELVLTHPNIAIEIALGLPIDDWVLIERVGIRYIMPDDREIWSFEDLVDFGRQNELFADADVRAFESLPGAEDDYFFYAKRLNYTGIVVSREETLGFNLTLDDVEQRYIALFADIPSMTIESATPVFLPQGEALRVESIMPLSGLEWVTYLIPHGTRQYTFAVVSPSTSMEENLAIFEDVLASFQFVDESNIEQMVLPSE